MLSVVVGGGPLSCGRDRSTSTASLKSSLVACFNFKNEASCSTLSVCQTDPSLVGSMNMYCESYDIFVVKYTRLAN